MQVDLELSQLLLQQCLSLSPMDMAGLYYLSGRLAPQCFSSDVEMFVVHTFMLTLC